MIIVTKNNLIMKKLFLLSILLCTCLIQALAYEWTDANGVTWTFSQQSYWWDENGVNTNHSLWTITGAANYGDEVTVPEKVYDGVTPHTVEAIGGGVFQNNLTLNSVSLPTTIEYIGSYAFYGCSALTTITGTANCEVINYCAFLGCSSLGSIDLTQCISIGNNSFSECNSLTTIGSIANCSTIEGSAFYRCSSLQEVDLSDNVQIGSDAFCDCTALTSVGSLNGATIGSEAFRNCQSLTTVDISQAASLGSYAFCDCSNLTSVGDLSAYTAIPEVAFYNCNNLESVNLSNCRTIGSSAFYNCQKLETVDLSKVTSIGGYAFEGCSALETVGDISAFTTIPDGLFWNCTKLHNVSLPNATSVGERAFAGCASITEMSLPKATSIGGGAFAACTKLATVDLPLCQTISYYSGNIKANGVNIKQGGAFRLCSSLTSINLPKVRTIGNYAFYDCSQLNAPNITSTELTSIGSNAFNIPGTITLMTTTPATLGSSNAFGTLMVVRVPDVAVADYRVADKWSTFKARIVGISAQLDYNVNVTAMTNKSALIEEIGENNTGLVVSLKITGDINGYDIMAMRNKMDNLHYLDLSDANIVANDYEYYTGHHTEDNILGARSFYNLSKLISVKLPKTITSVGDCAFSGCSNLKEVEFQSGIESIGTSAFSGCGNLLELELKSGLKYIGYYAFSDSHKFEEVILPEGLETIADEVFYNNTNLKRIAFPSTLKTIGYQSFCNCSQLTTISLPTSLESIPERAFHGCSGLTEVRIPSTITWIGDQAFSGCSNLNDVFTYIAEPTQIDMNTFSTYTSALLHVPSTSYWNYYYDTEWSQFRDLTEFDAEYEYFYINKDFTISDDAGTIQGDGENDPDADLNPGSGLIIETGENNKQELNEVHIMMKGSDCASIIAASNIVANKVYFDIEVQKARWYFLCFPFNVKMVNVQAPGNYTFRTYDPVERANGKTGWVNWIGDELEKGQGYIFHCSKAGILSLCVEKEDMNWVAEDRPATLEANAAESQEDASWNFIGNPHTSYYDIEKTGYTQPITVWNGSSYEAVRPGDDEYCLSPFEGFFVQKPDGESEMNFPAGEEATDGRYTQIQWEASATNRAAARRAKGVNVDRQMINLTLTDGQATDKTRIVFNEKQSQNYEMACDAPKFMSTESVPQMYTLDQKNTKYAINERPMGEVRLGYVATKKGELTISAVRMDQPVLLRDNLMQTTHDLSMGGYTFATEAGTIDDRFMLVMNGDYTSIGKLCKDTGVSALAEKGGINFSGIDQQEVTIYSVSGVTLGSHVQNGFIQLPSAAYIVKVNNETTKLIVR